MAIIGPDGATKLRFHPKDRIAEKPLDVTFKADKFEIVTSPTANRRLDKKILRAFVQPHWLDTEDTTRKMVGECVERMREQIKREAPDCSGCAHGSFEIEKAYNVAVNSTKYAVTARCQERGGCIMPTSHMRPLFSAADLKASDYTVKIDSGGNVGGIGLSNNSVDLSTISAGAITPEKMADVLAMMDQTLNKTSSKFFNEEWLTKPASPPKHENKDTPATASDAW